MGIELEISPIVFFAALSAYQDGPSNITEEDTEFLVESCIKAAAPLIVAAELLRLAGDFERQADRVPIVGEGGAFRATLLKCADVLRSRASELNF